MSHECDVKGWEKNMFGSEVFTVTIRAFSLWRSNYTMHLPRLL